MATATERKFTNLRKRLDQLGYRQSLGVESLPLVEKLFGDLLHTTESLKGAKQQLGKHQEQKTVWEQQVREKKAYVWLGVLVHISHLATLPPPLPPGGTIPS